MRKIDLDAEINIIKEFIRDFVYNAGFKRVILGISGGLDSALSACLCSLALGSENVLGLIMPYKTSVSSSQEHAILLCQAYKISYEIIPITKMVDAYFDEFETGASLLRRGNRMARERMCILYDLSAKYQALVVGTTNKTEFYIGYSTQYGDNACAFEPIAHLYKTEVREMAKKLNIPSVIINKAPSADLWEGQTDEEEIGVCYPVLDEIIFNLIEERKDREYLIEKGFSETIVDTVIQKIKNSEFKRQLPPTL